MRGGAAVRDGALSVGRGDGTAAFGVLQHGSQTADADFATLVATILSPP